MVLTVFALIMLGLWSVYSLSILDVLFYLNATIFYHYKDKQEILYPDGTDITGALTSKNLVEITKSFRNSSGFYKINGTLENQGVMILTDIKVIKYYKIPSVNDTTLICYVENIVSCEYNPIDQSHPRNFFLTIPDTNIKSKR